MQKKNDHYDIVIAGAGFAGSITALALQKIGLKVCLLEKGKQPRFAIGESSTPVADMILRKLSSTYDLPWLYDFSRYGSWQESHSEIVCGIKRGFSFFKHLPHQKFATDENHKNELLVAASSSDVLSDTNWLRADIDAFLVEKVKESGIDYFDLTKIIEAKKNANWQFHLRRLNEQRIISSAFFIDATGSSYFAEKFLKTTSSSEDFLTDSFAIFSHFENVPHWKELLQNEGISTRDFPYDPDNSALHQIMDEGWMWMLRFNDERISIGFVLDEQNGLYNELSTEQIWNDLLKKYPSIQDLLKEAKLHPQPGKTMRSQRLQRKLKNAYGDGWAALPHTIGFVDPLFSSGIAHSLSGVEKLVDIIKDHWSDEDLLQKNLQEYESKVFEELKLMDCLIGGCYKTMNNFQLFNAWSMLYFACTIAHEQRRLNNSDAGFFLNADDPNIAKMVYSSYEDLLKTISAPVKEEEIKNFTALIKERIEPFNSAGLLDPSANNMYHHTVAVL